MTYITKREVLLEKDKPLKSFMKRSCFPPQKPSSRHYELVERFCFPSGIILQIDDAVKKKIEPQNKLFITCKNLAKFTGSWRRFNLFSTYSLEFRLILSSIEKNEEY